MIVDIHPAPLRQAVADDRGSASLEFTTAGLLLLVPLVYLILVVSALQGASLGVEGAARQAARVYVQEPTVTDARAAAADALAVSLADYGVSADQGSVVVTCTPVPTNCLQRGSDVTVTVRASVPLPLVPAVLGISEPPSIPVQAAATVQVSRFGPSR